MITKIRWVVLIGTFLTIALCLAHHAASFGDEGYHTGVAKSLLLSGQQTLWNEDTDQLTSTPYSRGIIITTLTLLGYQIFGYGLFGPRVFMIFFPLIAWGLFLIYCRKRDLASWNELFISGILFLGHSFLIETSIYIRFYGALLLPTLLALIFTWESLHARSSSQRLIYFLATLFALLVPLLDGWQFLTLPILLLALGFYFYSELPLLQRFLKQHARLIGILALGFVLLAPWTVAVLDFAMAHLTVGSRPLGRTHVTYWDNLIGLLRILIASGVLYGLTLHFFRKGKFRLDSLSFFEWITLTGLGSALLLAVYTPHSHAFYTRYYVVPLALGGLGLGPLLHRWVKAEERQQLLLLFLICNLASLIVVFQFDRMTPKPAIQWLANNTQSDDLVLSDYTMLAVQGGEAIQAQLLPVPRTRDGAALKEFRTKIQTFPKGKVYFFYGDPYAFRDRLYAWTLGEERSPPEGSFQRFLAKRIPGREIDLELTAMGLRSIKKQDLLAGLQRFQSLKVPQRRSLLRKTYELFFN